MAIDFNNDPYFDDFDVAGADGLTPKEKYYRILFRPSVALQARELTQLQSTLQNQISSFGDHMFEDGAMIIPGSTAVDKEYGFVKLLDSFGGSDIETYLSELNGTKVTGQTTGVEAKCVGVVSRTDGGDPPTLFVKYLNSGTDKVTKQFAADETLISDGTNTRSVTIEAAAETPVGFGSAAKIEPGVYYVNGTFAYVTTQTLVLSKYSTNPSARIGLTISETTVSAQEDQTLNDNAAGSPNFAAPGAHRYQITLTLDSKDINGTDDDNFIELIRIVSGNITKQVRSTEYAVLEDTLARRTYDESGNYTVRPFNIDVREHLKEDGNRGIYTAAEGGDETKLAVGFEPGKAYVRGYEIDTLSTTYVDIDKARDTQQYINFIAPFFIGNYTLVNTVSGIPQIDVNEKLELLDNTSGGAVVGSARARAFEYDSGTAGTSGAVYKLYLFDIQMNTNKTFLEDVKQIRAQNYTAGTFEFIGNTVLDGSSYAQIITPPSAKNNMFIQLPNNTVKSIRNSAGEIDTSIQVTRVIRRNLTGGISSINLTTTGETFETPYDPNDYTMVGDDGTVYDLDASTGRLTLASGDNTTLNIDLSGEVSVPASVTIIATVNVGQAQHKQKNLQSNFNHNIDSPNSTANGYDSLGKADIYRLVGVYDSLNPGVNATTSDLDITERYELDDGQRDNFYNLGRIRLKPGFSSPTGRILVVFDYFTHTSGNYFAVDSYSPAQVDYEDIPTYNLAGETIQLRDVLDFRPRIADSGDDFDENDGAENLEIPRVGSNMTLDFNYYLPRIDKVYLDPNGNFRVLEGVSSPNPATPPDPDDGMVIYSLYMNAYTFNTSDLTPNFIDNKRYTMRDIGRLETRIKNLEYYTSLSLLEKETADIQILDTNNVDRFKSGFVVDPFYGHNVGNPSDPDYHISIDAERGEARPQFYEDSVRININESLSSNYQITGDVVSLPYSEVKLIEQPFASQAENVNPYDVFQWVGQIDMSPSNDDWKDTETRPELIVDNQGLFDVVNSLSDEAGVLGTVWNEWETQWAGREIVVGSSDTQRDGRRLFQDIITAQQATQARSGIRTSVSPDTIQTSFGERVVDIRMVPFIRSRRVKFKATRLKPNTKFFAFFEDVNVSDFTRPISASNFVRFVDTPVDPEPDRDAVRHPELTSTDITNGANALFSDATGTLHGEFYIPNTDSVRFRTGNRLFKLIDTDSGIDANITSSARATYSANGLVEVKQEVSLRSPSLIQENVQDINRNVTIFNTSTRTVGWVDPLAQTFLIDTDNGAFLTKVGIYFKSKDLNIPITLQIRAVVNGYPSNEIVPFGEVVLPAANVNVSEDASAETLFTLPSPVYLRQDTEYAVCLLANSNQYEAWIAELGQNAIGTTRRISTQPYAGVMFKSQNGSTWSADQTKDMKFTMYRASFDTSASQVVFQNGNVPLRNLRLNPFFTTSSSSKVIVKHPNHGMFEGSEVALTGCDASVNGIPASDLIGQYTITDVEIDQYQITVNTAATSDGNGGGANVFATEDKRLDVMNPAIQQMILPSTNIAYEFRAANTKSLAGSETNLYEVPVTYSQVVANTNYYPDAPKVIASSVNETINVNLDKSFWLRATLSSAAENLSPMIDLERTSIVSVSNRIDNPKDPLSSETGKNSVVGFTEETEATGGSALAKYITRKITLNNTSVSLRIVFGGNRPAGSFIDVYFKTQASEDETPFDEIGWTLATIDSTVPTTDDRTIFSDYEYTIDNITPNFNAFAVKVVMRSQSSTAAPRIRDFRAIALGT